MIFSQTVNLLFKHLKQSVLVQGTRGHKMTIMKSWTGGIKYPGFTYFPRPGQVDPPYEATKLFMVQRIKPFKNNPQKLKRILTSIGLSEDKPSSTIGIVKNTTDMNAKLWKVKHLIKITPIRTPDGLPLDGDYSRCHLNEKGEFRVQANLKPDLARIEAYEKFINSPKKVKRDIWKKECRLRWLTAWSTTDCN